MQSRIFKTKFTVEDHDGDDLNLIVNYTYWKGDPGCHTQRNGDPGWPPEPAAIEIEMVTDADNLAEVTLSAKELERLEEMIMESL